MYSIGIDIAGITGKSAVTLSRIRPNTKIVECVLLKDLVQKRVFENKEFDKLTIADIGKLHIDSIFEQVKQVINDHHWDEITSVTKQVRLVIDAPLDLQGVKMDLFNGEFATTANYQSTMKDMGKRAIDVKYGGVAPTQLLEIILHSKAFRSHEWFTLDSNLFETYPKAILQAVGYFNENGYKGKGTKERALLDASTSIWKISKGRNKKGEERSEALLNASQYFKIAPLNANIVDYTEDNFESILCSLVGLAPQENVLHTSTCFGVAQLPEGYRVLKDRSWYTEVAIIDKK